LAEHAFGAFPDVRFGVAADDAAMDGVPELSTLDLVARLGVAALLGGVIGIERELRERFAGLRTHLLVSVGAALFTIVSVYAWDTVELGGGITMDPSRIAAGIVTGIGFIGAGAILRHGRFVRGLTTAASLWVAAAIGLAAGMGYYAAAMTATAIVLVTLWPLRALSQRLFERYHAQEAQLTFELRDEEAPGDVIREIERLGGSVESVEVAHTNGTRTLELGAEFAHGERDLAIAKLSVRERVVGARWRAAS
jgi:putative Mg2+ transporter-C (MgtC) family protein